MRISQNGGTSKLEMSSIVRTYWSPAVSNRDRFGVRAAVTAREHVVAHYNTGRERAGAAGGAGSSRRT